ncbi:MAG: 4-hydroxy-tetrahydrodipicolinate synthase [Clostridia bacterium]|nr:4-hydroxy-tetrahydrodipicolinate synthase [Clostridia bacterium]
MKKPIFVGSAVALVTPFDEKGVNFKKIEELVEYHIAHKTDAIVVCATTGEAPTLEDDDHKKALLTAVQTAKGRIPIIAGTGSNYTDHAIMMSQYAEEIGCDGVLLVTPYYNKTTQRGLYQHFKAIAESTSLPIILYNIPGRTAVNISLETYIALDKFPNIVGVKEATGDVALASRIINNTDFNVYSGNDDIIVPIMSVGGKGVISVVANIMPEETHNVCIDYLNGETEKSRKQFLSMLDLIDSLFCEVNPVPIKTAMNILGFDVGGVRLPLFEMEDKNIERLKNSLKKCNLI